MLDINNLISCLRKRRKVFQSEADFQHELAWEINKTYPQAKIRLERNMVDKSTSSKKEVVDIWVEYNRKVYAIELKYKTSKIVLNDNEEKFKLLNQSARDLGKYDFIKDIVRLEGWKKSSGDSRIDYGYAIFLTNDIGYWKKSIRPAADASFRIYEGRELKGKLGWSNKSSGSKVSNGTMKGRENDLQLSGSYTIHWNNYADLNNKKASFKYILVKI